MHYIGEIRKLFLLTSLTICSCVYGQSCKTVKLIDLNTEQITQPVRKAQLNKSIDNNPLRISGVEYTEGLGLHAKCVFSVDVSGCEKFEALVGIDNETKGTEARVNCIIVGDGKKILESGLIEDGDEPFKINVDLGEHVPYPIEAYPEGNKRHLTAESALYCRVMTEGLFGIRPTGLKSFTCSPKLPSGWNEMSLKNIRAFGTSFDIIVKRDNSTIVKIYEKGKEVLSKAWDLKDPIEVRLSK